jgi:RNA 2',3'-cyclic 3'-phosphodiesterase
VRLFVAIALDQASRDRVVAEQRRLVSALGPAARSLRLVGPERLHLTLAFIGEIDERHGVSIARRFGVDIEQPRFTLTLGGAGVFPVRGSSRVLWLGLVDGVGEVAALREHVMRRLGESDLELDRQQFSPHLTLGRWRVGEARVRLAPGRSEAGIARVPVNEVTLFESRLAATGSAYTALAHACLSCPSSS